MGKPSALLDSSVLITALLSSRGGSFYLIANGKRFVTLQTSDYLVTLDNDFLQPQVRTFAARRGVTILKPRAFIPMVWGIR